MASSPSATLTCTQCNYVNEAERVYCHNCGSKLDRSLLPKETENEKESLQKTRRRVKKLTNPGANPVGREVKALVNTLLWAAVIAALILVVRQPEGVPPINPATLPTRIVSSELEAALSSPQPRSVQFSEDETNAHLRQSLRSKATGGLVKFERAYVKFEPGVVRITMQQSLWGFSIFSSSYYNLAIREGRLVAANTGGQFGRLAVHPALMQYADVAFSKLWAALRQERDELNALRDIRIGRGQILLITKGAQR